MKKFFLILLMLIFSSLATAREEILPKPGDDIVGSSETATVQDGEDFSDVALRYDIGFYELHEANFGVNPDNPPAGTELIVPSQYILPKELKENLILINLAEMRLYYIPKGGNKVYIFPVGIGKVDWDTPTGQTKVIKKIEHPNWIIPENIRKYRAFHGEIMPKIIPSGEENPMGSYALRLGYGDYLIHGTNLPAGVGRRSSAGCIRLYEQDIKILFNLVETGTPVLIINQPYKAGWLNSKLYLEAHLPLFEQRFEQAANDMAPIIEVLKEANKNAQVDIRWDKAFKIATEHLNVPRLVS